MAYTLYKNITTVNREVGKNSKNNIVIHYTGNKTDTAKANANYFKSVNRGSSAHYFVDETTVYQVVEDNDAAWAVGKNYGSNNLFGKVTNYNSINIEMCSTNGKIADATFDNTVVLTKSLMKKYNIPASNVYRHWDICSKACPGWDGWGADGKDASIWNKFKQKINGSTSTSSSVIYRVRKTWADTSSQIGAYSSLENAKEACKEGYSVFDNNGKVVYSKSTSTSTSSSSTSKTSTTSSSSASTKLTVDGLWGTATTKRLQAIFGTTCDGIISNQYSSIKSSNPGLTTGWEFKSNPKGSGGSSLIKAIQKKVGATVNGFAGKDTFKKMQKWLGTTQDGVVSNPSSMVKALQRWCNNQ